MWTLNYDHPVNTKSHQGCSAAHVKQYNGWLMHWGLRHTSKYLNFLMITKLKINMRGWNESKKFFIAHASPTIHAQLHWVNSPHLDWWAHYWMWDQAWFLSSSAKISQRTTQRRKYPQQQRRQPLSLRMKRSDHWSNAEPSQLSS